MKNKKIVITMVIILVILLGVCGMVYGMTYKDKKDNEAEQSADSQSDEKGSSYITYEGQKYKYNSDLKTVLFLGIDNKGTTVDVQGTSGFNGQADTIILFVMDKSSKKTTMLQVSRNSMTDIKLYNSAGVYAGTDNAQLALQFAFGDGKKKSCQLTKDAVSNLLYDIPIHSYLGLNVDGVDKVVDLIGGITITMPKDYTYVNPEFTQGTTLKLDGEKAEKFVRYRNVDEAGSNEERMERQIVFLKVLAAQLKEKFGGNSALYDMIFQGADAYMLTDMPADDMKLLSEYEMSEEVLKVPGETRVGKKYDEYMVNDTELYKMLLKVFYKSVD